jgi:hypothetical protein
MNRHMQEANTQTRGVSPGFPSLRGRYQRSLTFKCLNSLYHWARRSFIFQRVATTHDGLRSAADAHTAAPAETKDFVRGSHRASDSQPRGHSGSAIWCPALRRRAQGTRFRRWSAQCPSVSISNISPATVKRDGINDASASDPARSRRAADRFRREWSHFLIYDGAVMIQVFNLDSSLWGKTTKCSALHPSSLRYVEETK